MFFPIWACALLLVLLPGLCVVGYRRGVENGFDKGKIALRKKYKSLFGDVLDDLGYYRNLHKKYGGKHSPYEQLYREQQQLKKTYRELTQAIEAFLYAHENLKDEAAINDELSKTYRESYDHWLNGGMRQVLRDGKQQIAECTENQTNKTEVESNEKIQSGSTAHENRSAGLN